MPDSPLEALKDAIEANGTRVQERLQLLQLLETDRSGESLRQHLKTALGDAEARLCDATDELRRALR